LLLLLVDCLSPSAAGICCLLVNKWWWRHMQGQWFMLSRS
jgi:hypothetical protein